jgi:hypothetical protein
MKKQQPITNGPGETVAQNKASFSARTKPLTDHAKILKSIKSAGIPAHMQKAFGK